jgi:hypothetical protein
MKNFSRTDDDSCEMSVGGNNFKNSSLNDSANGHIYTQSVQKLAKHACVKTICESVDVGDLYVNNKSDATLINCNSIVNGCSTKEGRLEVLKDTDPLSKSVQTSSYENA